MSKYIIMGGAGFIGSHITNKLLSEGHQVVVVDNFCTGFAHYLPKHENLTVLTLDVTDWVALTKHAAYFKGAECVFHLAAVARIQPSIYSPALTHDTNTTGTFNVLELMRMLGIPSIVYSASSSYYGLKTSSPSVETDEPDCQTPYAASKYMGELYCSTWFKLYGIRSTRLRYFNVWGTRSPTEGPYAPVISKFMVQALANIAITAVGDGLQRRDFTHVEDVVRANLFAAEKMSHGPFSETINIGTGKNYSILDVANMVKLSVESATSKKCSISHVPERIGEARYSLANNEKARRILGWEPKHGLESKIDELRNYYIKGET